ncbi:secretion system protein [Pseudoalteromonas agarivorans]|uniref:Secretion system protein n=1 Tax=Pseudoalteromonas agarivorans TaxID=176102 RepID=A0ABR5VT66_9GAMM|nr:MULTISPECIES: type II secretion system F family protein [Pseudoalteromonas]KYL34124.1 secretion system protein [Pseudoalteromonas telluritireducens]MDC9511825.1 type II secretion system F family protein [Pseudoalteromonas sp. CST1]MDC9536061.1 type II secretion system F family protein [Pseudoalteromonas sp. CST3]MDC9540576.1 type II secretion system F family protein [Pseudoalteromonas sp. CST2]MDC9547337.1 type II secretion system F family protein [Pseudoalteromonas sp. CST4]
MIDIFLFVGLLVSMGAFIHIQKQSLKAEVQQPIKTNINWYPLIVISKNQFRQAGYQLNKILLSMYCFKMAATFCAYTAIEITGYVLSTPLVAIICFISFFAPDMWFLFKKGQRKVQINNSLEFFLSVLLVYMRAGFSLERAFALAVDHGLSKKHPLYKELKLFLFELSAGKDRETAFNSLYDRTGVSGLKKLANLMLIGSKLGTPLIQAVESQLESFALKKNILLAKKVNKKALHTTFPIILICFPMFLVLVFFPAALQVMNVLKMLVEVL